MAARTGGAFGRMTGPRMPYPPDPSFGTSKPAIMSESKRETSCYVLYIELDSPGGGDRRETFTYAKPAHVLSTLRQELEGKLVGRLAEVVEAVCVRSQVITVGVIERGVLTDAIDVRRFVRVRSDDGESAPVDEVNAEWSEEDDWPTKAGGARLIGFELDEHALLEALPALSEPLLGPGQSASGVKAKSGEKRSEVTALAKRLRNVTYGYADAAGDYVSRDRFEDPDPPSLDDVEAWTVQRPSSRVSVEIARRIAARGDRDGALRWVEKAKREALPMAPLEAVLREAFATAEGAPPLRSAARVVSLDTDLLKSEPRWAKAAELLALVPEEGTDAVEEKLRVLSRETPDTELAVVAFLLRRHLGRARGAAHSAMMLKHAMQRSVEVVLPGVLAGAEATAEEEPRAIEALRESARRLEARGGTLTQVDELLLRMLPTTFDGPRIARAADRLAKVSDWTAAASLMLLADRVVSDPSDVCEVAADAARLLLKANRAAEARDAIERALAYWQAHAWMRGNPPHDLPFWHAAAEAALGNRAALDALLARAERYRTLAERELPSQPKPAPVAVERPRDGSLRAGDRVGHAKFGGGVVELIEGAGESAKVTVRFDSGETKTLLGRFVRPEA
jgi:hypothetical protein